MKRIFQLQHFIIFVALLFFFVPKFVFSEGDKFTVKIYFVDGDPAIINDFFCDDRGISRSHWNSYWKGGNIDLHFKDIKTVRFLEPGKNSKAEVVFKDGKKDIFNLNLHRKRMKGISKYGPWNSGYSNVAKIEFISPIGSPFPVLSESSEFDQIILKNGDIITGSIKNDIFTLRTSYGTLQFEAKKIQNINFEGGGQNIDVVILKIGDKMSGVIQEPDIMVHSSTGAEITLDKEKVKDINFRK